MSPLPIPLRQSLAELPQALTQLRGRLDTDLVAEASKVARIPSNLRRGAAEEQPATAVRLAQNDLAQVRLALDVGHATRRQRGDDCGMHRMAVGRRLRQQRRYEVVGWRVERPDAVDAVGALFAALVGV